MLNKFLRENKVSKMTKAKRNAWYNSLSKPEKAIAVCEDVLLQIKNEKYVMTSGIYAQLEFNDDVTQRTVNDIIKKDALDELVGAKSVVCNVCAIGSAFMSCVRLGNEVATEDMFSVSTGNKDWYGDYEYTPGGFAELDSDSMVNKLEEVFTEKEFRGMEFMFEGYNVTSLFQGMDSSILAQFSDDNYSHLDETEKMIKMCKQIIKDKGYFFVKGVDLENKNK